MKTLLLVPAFFVALIAGAALIDESKPLTGIGTIPSIVSFTATPRVAKPGQAVTLRWKARGADSLELDWSTDNKSAAAEPQRQELADSGEMVVHPQKDTLYKLTCVTPDGPMCSTELTVPTE